jgi:hypothetical protein
MTGNMKKGYSLHIGLNKLSKSYYGKHSPLNCCRNDAEAMAHLAKELGYKPILLLDEDANYENVKSEIDATTYYMESDDIFLLTFSGHGTQVVDRNGDEIDGFDESWVLFDRLLIDDELNQMFSQFPPDSRIVVISDSCHSGSIADIRPAHSKHLTKASGILISSCRDKQISYDGGSRDKHSLFTDQLLKVWSNGEFQGNYKQLHSAIAKGLPSEQTPNYLTFGVFNSEFVRQRAFLI